MLSWRPWSLETDTAEPSSASCPALPSSPSSGRAKSARRPWLARSHVDGTERRTSSISSRPPTWRALRIRCSPSRRFEVSSSSTRSSVVRICFRACGSSRTVPGDPHAFSSSAAPLRICCARAPRPWRDASLITSCQDSPFPRSPSRRRSPLAPRRLPAVLHGPEPCRQLSLARRLHSHLPRARRSAARHRHPERGPRTLLVDAGSLSRSGVERIGARPGVRRLPSRRAPVSRCPRVDVHAAEPETLERESQEAASEVSQDLHSRLRTPPPLPGRDHPSAA